MKGGTYVLVDPFTKKTRYVGYTVSHINARLAGHISDAKIRADTPKGVWINNIILAGLKPLAFRVCAYDVERRVIFDLLSDGCELFNKNMPSHRSIESQMPDARRRIFTKWFEPLPVDGLDNWRPEYDKIMERLTHE